jgi:NADPH-dependent glutamate synthase beta subunit-like oxidoreductase
MESRQQLVLNSMAEQTKIEWSEPPVPVAAKKVIIIGGGIAGLSCGCYLQMNGIQS